LNNDINNVSAEAKLKTKIWRKKNLVGGKKFSATEVPTAFQCQARDPGPETRDSIRVDHKQKEKAQKVTPKPSKPTKKMTPAFFKQRDKIGEERPAATPDPRIAGK